jgi:cytosine/adenosine deaminase-related metal-dependent hydrolase
VGEGIDGSSEQEFETLKKKGLLRANVVLIHAIPFKKSQFEEIANSKAFVVWSPRSNLALYGKTLNVRAALDAGVTVALAPDWSITGSSNLLQEIKCASEYASGLTAKEIFKMVTENAAKVAGADSLAGKIAPGFQADFLLARIKDQDPFKSLIHTEEADVRLVAIGGKPIVGDPETLSKWATSEDAVYEVISIKNQKESDRKAVDVSKPIKGIRLSVNPAIQGQDTLSGISRSLVSVGPIAPLVEAPTPSVCKAAVSTP